MKPVLKFEDLVGTLIELSTGHVVTVTGAFWSALEAPFNLNLTVKPTD